MARWPSSARWVLLGMICVIAEVSGDIGSIIDCGTDNRCKGKDPAKHPQMFKPTAESISRCYCDDACLEYGDCCVDKAPYPQNVNKIKWSCVYRSLNQSLYAVSNCIQNNEWKQLCEKEYYPPKFGHLVDIPFYWNITGRYYANIFCALCDPQIETSVAINTTIDMVPSELTTICSANITEEMTVGEYQNGKMAWKVGDGFCVYNPRDDLYGRVCVPAVSSCPPGSGSVLTTKCTAYSLLISIKNKVYRNPHCAVCNGVNESDLICTSNNKITGKILPTLQVLLDFDWVFDICSSSDGVLIKNQLDENCTAISCQTTGCTVKDCNSEPSCKSYSPTEGYLTYACLSLSIVCLLIHVCKSIFVARPDTLPAKYLNSLAWSLLIAQTFLLCGTYPLTAIPTSLCYAISIVIEYFFLASFIWMNVISIDIWKTFSNTFRLIFTSYARYALYAWGGAMLITATSVLGDRSSYVPNEYRPNYGTQKGTCWFGNTVGLALFFGFPVLVILIFNCILFFMTISLLRQQQSSSVIRPSTGRKQYNTLLLFVKLSTIMGLTWIFGFILNLFINWSQRGYPFIVLNGLQGVFIFIIFDLKTDKLTYFVKTSLFKFFGEKKFVIEGNREL